MGPEAGPPQPGKSGQQEEDTMQTMDRPVAEAGPPATTRRPWWRLAIAVALALVLGVVGGWSLARVTDDEPTAVVAGGGSLTDRQKQIVEVLDDYVAAWRSDDAEAVMAFFAPGGTFSVRGEEYRMDDGSMAAFLESASWSTLTGSDPVLMAGDEAALHTTWESQSWFNVIEFSASGDVLIVRHVSTG
jgi:hypothetical protein